MLRASCLMWCLSMVTIESEISAQSLFSPRAIGVAASIALARDVREFAANPAGLTGIQDWEITTMTYAPMLSPGYGFVFGGVSVGKRFLENNALGLQYSPGSSLDFVLPSAARFTQTTTPVSIDTRIRYEDPLSLGYGVKVSNPLSIGVSARLKREDLTNTQLVLDTAFVVSENEYKADAWVFDVGCLWSAQSGITLSAVVRNLFSIGEGGLPSEFQNFALSRQRDLEIGCAYSFDRVQLAVQASTAKHGTIGYEWSVTPALTLRDGLYFDDMESPFVYGFSAGVGFSLGLVEADASYISFFNKSERRGATALGSFDAGRIRDIDLNPYTSDRLSFSLKAVLGNIRESLARIESVEMLGGIYPSSYETLAYQPVGKVRIRNISRKPIQAKASFFVERYMDAPTETPQVYLNPDEEQVIPLTAVFNELVRRIPRMTIYEGRVSVSATPAREYDDTFQTRVLIHGKNDWDGDVRSLRYFVTPDDPAVIRYSREVLLQQRDTLAAVPPNLEKFYKAKILFRSFAGKIIYVNDPKQSADYVQYPAETLQLRGGDCDDMTVCFSSLLNSIGISTAFVDVAPPDRAGESHIYLLFDTGLSPEFGKRISENPKRYLVRKNPHGVDTMWIPVETTVIMRGFDEAWTSGAQEYFDDTEIGLGLVKGWVKILDVY
jgi:hypothetical protein